MTPCRKKFLAPLAFIARRLKGFRPEKLTGLPFPPVISVETTNACNADCIMCPSKKSRRRIGTMDFDIFKKIVDESSPHANRIKFFGLHLFGEPLLDKDIFRRIEYAKRKGIKNLGFFTNGSLLTGETAELLVKSGLDYVTISLDGATKKTYEDIRRNLNFEEVTDNIRELIKIRNSCEVRKPRVHITFTRMHENETEEEELINKWKGVVDFIKVNDVNSWGGLMNGRGKRVFSKERHPCSRLWLNPVILCNGELALCCIDFEGRIRLGSTEHHKILELWNSRRLAELRDCHLKNNYDSIPLCKNCDAWRSLDPWWWW